jgi:hypothetical protein
VLTREHAAIAFCAFFLAALPAAPAQASPWPRDAGRLFTSTRADNFRAERPTEADALGPRRLERQQANVYAEYGLDPNTTLAAKIVYGTIAYFDGYESFAAEGVSEIEIAVQRRLLQRRNDVLSARLAGAAPSRFETGARPDMTSDGYDIEARLLYGRNVAPGRVKTFAGVEAAYRRRFGDGADQIRLDFTLGVEPSARLLLLIETFAVKSVGAAAPGGADYDVIRLQPSAAWRFSPRWAVQLGASREIAGRNLLRGDAWFLGLWTSF